MSFAAKLFLDNTERFIQDASVLFRQSIDRLQRPCSYPQGGLINLKIESTREDLFWEWAISPTMMKEGYIRFYKPDGLSKFADLEFWDCYCISFSESYSHNTPEAMYIDLVLSPGVLRFRGVVFEKHWKVTDLSRITGQAISFNEYSTGQKDDIDDKPKIIRFYFTDKKGNTLEEITENQVVLVVETKNMIGQTINIDLSDNQHDFIYNGELIENDIIENLTISGNETKINLEVIKQIVE